MYTDWIRLYKSGGKISDTAVPDAAGELLMTFQFSETPSTTTGSSAGSVTTLTNGVSQFEAPSGHLHVKVLSGSLPASSGKKSRFVDIACESSAWSERTATLENAGNRPEWRQGFVVPVHWQPEAAEVPSVVLRVMHGTLLGSSCEGTVVVAIPPFVMCPRQVGRPSLCNPVAAHSDGALDFCTR